MAVVVKYELMTDYSRGKIIMPPEWRSDQADT